MQNLLSPLKNDFVGDTTVDKDSINAKRTAWIEAIPARQAIFVSIL